MINPAIDLIATKRLLPVVVLQRVADAVPLARALAAGGLPLAEVTFRTDAAADSIRAIRAGAPDMRVGAGTVTSRDQVDAAIAAGAEFIVTPGLNPRVIERALERGIAIHPGVNAPGFVEMALEFGLDTLKFFPAEPSGGLPFIRALAGPYPQVRFMPTGGIGPGNLASYLAAPNVLACGGSWMVDPALIAAGDFAAITRLTAEAVAIAAG